MISSTSLELFELYQQFVGHAWTWGNGQVKPNNLIRFSKLRSGSSSFLDMFEHFPFICDPLVIKVGCRHVRISSVFGARINQTCPPQLKTCNKRITDLAHASKSVSDVKPRLVSSSWTCWFTLVTHFCDKSCLARINQMDTCS
jgi:hypothetical protein